MKIITNNVPFVFSALIPEKELKVKTRKDDNGIEQNSLHEGKVVYRTALKALSLDENGTPTREEKNVSVALVNPNPINSGVFYVLVGKIWITPYIAQNGRIGYSIIAEGLKAVENNK